MSGARFSMGDDVTVVPCSDTEVDLGELHREGSVMYFKSWAELWRITSDEAHALHRWQYYMQQRKKYLLPCRFQRIRVSFHRNCGMPDFALVPIAPIKWCLYLSGAAVIAQVLYIVATG